MSLAFATSSPRLARREVANIMHAVSELNGKSMLSARQDSDLPISASNIHHYYSNVDKVENCFRYFRKSFYESVIACAAAKKN